MNGPTSMRAVAQQSAEWLAIDGLESHGRAPRKGDMLVDRKNPALTYQIREISAPNGISGHSCCGDFEYDPRHQILVFSAPNTNFGRWEGILASEDWKGIPHLGAEHAP